MFRVLVRAALVAGVCFAALIVPVAAHAAPNGDVSQTLANARTLTHRLHSFHADDEGVFGPPTRDYCSSMRAARSALSRLEAEYDAALRLGNLRLAGRIWAAGNALADEIAEEEYLDDEYGPKEWCSPTAVNDFGVGGAIGLAEVVRPRFQFMVDIGGGTSSASANVVTSINPVTSASGSSGVNPTAYGFDFRLFWWLNPALAVTGGGWAKSFSGGTGNIALNLDNNPPPIDTWLSIQRTRFFLAYIGLTMAWPTISAIREGLAGTPEAGTFLTTFYFGPRFERLSGSTTTNENGQVARTNFNQSVTGYTFGFDLDYPLWVSGTATAIALGIRPMVGFGVAYDTFPQFTLQHTTALAFLYASQIAVQSAWRFHFRIGGQFAAQ